MCESPKTFEGRYFYCMHIKELKKNNSMNRFHRIGPKKKHKNKKIGIGPLKVWLSTHVRRVFKIMCESSKTFEKRYFYRMHVKELKKNNSMNRFHQIGPKKTKKK